MKKFVKGVSVLAALAMVNPATIVSATTATGQPQSDVTQSADETATTVKPIDRKHYMNNIFATSPSNYIAYSGMGNLDLRLYSNEHTQYLARMYIVMPKGLTVDGGLASMQVALENYRNKAKIHANGANDGTLSIQQLANTADGREVYEITPGTDNYVILNENPSQLPMTIPIRSADKSSGLTQILMNANTQADMKQDVLFAGSGDGQNVPFNRDSSYPQIAAQDVGIVGPDDQYVHGIVYPDYHTKMTFFTPKVTDHYQVIDPSVIDKTTQKPVIKETISSTIGDTGTTYSRVGLVDTLKSLKLDPAVYDEKSLAVDQGNLNDTSVILTPINSFTNNPNVPLDGQTYTITVKRFAKDVTVEYLDQNGKRLSDTTETLTGDVGDDYQAVHKDIAGYTATVGEDNQTGKFTDTPQMITYHYTKIPVAAKDITVNYEDADGKQLAAPETLTGNVDDPYATVKKEIMGYAFKKVANDNATGTFSETAQTVTYVYAKIGKDVTVNYEDESGNKIADSKTFTGNVGDSYTAVKKDVSGYVFKKVTGNETGTLGETAQTVTYVYAQIGKAVTVNYVNADGKQLADSEEFTGNVGEAYHAVQKDFDGYHFKRVEGNPDGLLTDQRQTVTYHYAKPAADVTVKYIYTKGSMNGQVQIPLADSVVKQGDIGDSYTTDDPQFAGYHLSSIKGAEATGNFTSKAQTVIYYYAKDPVKAADWTINYVDEAGKPLADSKVLSGNIDDFFSVLNDGLLKQIEGYFPYDSTGALGVNLTADPQMTTLIYKKLGAVTVNYEDESGKSIATSETLTGKVAGDKYQTKQKEISGYTFKSVSGGDETGMFLDKDITVTYVYTKNPVPAKPVTVNYQDASGKQLAGSETFTGNVDDPYTAVKKEISGYAFKKVTGNETGTLSETAQTVTYVYAKIGKDVTVNYVDAAGKELATSKTLSGNVGDKVNSEAVKVAGYAMVKTNATTDDIFTDDVQTFTYHYAKVADNVTVKYVDESGNEIAPAKALTGNVGAAYQAVQASIDGYTYKEVTDNAKGTFTDKPQTVTYVYTKNPVAGANVTVNYQDESGNQLAKPATLTGNVGAAYQAVQASITGYTYKQVIGQPTGTFSNAAQTVTYVYTKNPVVGANVTVNYQDEAGKQLAASAILTGNIDTSYHAVQATITGYHYKAVTGAPDGRFTANAQTVTYVYTKDADKPVKIANQTVKYVDENGQTIAGTEILTGNIGTPYHAIQKAVAGYSYKSVTGAPTGNFTTDAPTVTYIYTKDPVQGANVTVNYQDEAGKQIANPATLSGNVGSGYQAVQTPIDGYAFKQVIGTPTGTFSNAAQTVTYVYTKNPVQAGNVTVNYQDEAGNQLAKSATLTGNVGDNYQAVQLAVDGYTFQKVIGNPNGTLTDAAQSVTYVYAKTVTKPEASTTNSETKTEKPATNPAMLTNNHSTQPQPVQKPVAKQKLTKQSVKPATKVNKQLPQTSVTRVNSLLGIIGALLIAAVGVVFKKRKN